MGTDRPPAGNRVDVRFWDHEFLGDVELPTRPDPANAFERSLADALAVRAPAAASDEVLELGCAPARWLLFYAERFGALVRGVEYGERGAALSRANLAAAGVGGEIIEADVFDADIPPADLVLSLGFIEHFDDLDAAFRRHVELVRSGGRIVLGVPNFRGLNKLLQAWADPDHLSLHNLDAMRPELYRQLARRHGLEVRWQGYIGGFDPLIIKVRRRSALLATVPEGRWRRLALADRVNHPWLSSYLLTVLYSS